VHTALYCHQMDSRLGVHTRALACQSHNAATLPT
jgi:hypothetical protein